MIFILCMLLHLLLLLEFHHYELMWLILLVETKCDLNPCQSLTNCNRGPKYSLPGQVLEGVRTWYTVFTDCNMGINAALCSLPDLKVLEILTTTSHKTTSHKKKRLLVPCVLFFHINTNIPDLTTWLPVGLMGIIMIVPEHTVPLMWFNKMES